MVTHDGDEDNARSFALSLRRVDRITSFVVYLFCSRLSGVAFLLFCLTRRHSVCFSVIIFTRFIAAHDNEHSALEMCLAIDCQCICASLLRIMMCVNITFRFINRVRAIRIDTNWNAQQEKATKTQKSNWKKSSSSGSSSFTYLPRATLCLVAIVWAIESVYLSILPRLLTNHA